MDRLARRARCAGGNARCAVIGHLGSLRSAVLSEPECMMWPTSASPSSLCRKAASAWSVTLLLITRRRTWCRRCAAGIAGAPGSHAGSTHTPARPGHIGCTGLRRTCPHPLSCRPPHSHPPVDEVVEGRALPPRSSSGGRPRTPSRGRLADATGCPLLPCMFCADWHS
jgi:hypothetical protein